MAASVIPTVPGPRQLLQRLVVAIQCALLRRRIAAAEADLRWWQQELETLPLQIDAHRGWLEERRCELAQLETRP